MIRKIIVTADNSKSLFVPDLNETYHSVHGALNESRHVFIEHGLKTVYSDFPKIHILEMGFGTGLNALLTYHFSKQKNFSTPIIYSAIEKYPVEMETISQLDYTGNKELNHAHHVFQSMHESNWNESVTIHPGFELRKMKGDIADLNPGKEVYTLIYYDAFAPRVQPHLWQLEIFQKLYDSLILGGKLVSYCAQGQFRRNLREVGFQVEKHPGPPGKREMTVATKIS